LLRSRPKQVGRIQKTILVLLGASESQL